MILKIIFRTCIIFSNLYLEPVSQTLISTDLDICKQPSTDGLFVILFLKKHEYPTLSVIFVLSVVKTVDRVSLS